MSTNYFTSQRIASIDILKGVLLFCVCLGHFIDMPFFLSNFLSSTTFFRVPIFFFISGFLFSQSKYPNFQLFFISKFKTLVIPYIFLFSCFTIFDWNTYLHTTETIKYNFSQFLYGGPAKASALWFVIVLFYCNVLHYGMFLLTKFNFYKSIIIIVIIAICCYFLNLSNTRLIFHFDRVLACYICYALGNLFKKYVLFSTVKLSNKPTIFVLPFFLTLLLISFLLSADVKQTTLSENQIPNPINFYLSVITGSLGLITCFHFLLEKLSRFVWFGWVYRFFNYITKNSMIILGTHMYLIFVFDQILNRIGIFSIDTRFYIKLVGLSLAIYFMIIPILRKNFASVFNQKNILNKSMDPLNQP